MSALRSANLALSDLVARLLVAMSNHTIIAQKQQQAVRLGQELHAARQILETPRAVLVDRTPVAVMGNSLDGLRDVHRLAGKRVLPQKQWWRSATTAEGGRERRRKRLRRMEGKFRRWAVTPAEDSLMTNTINTTDHTHRLLAKVLRRANGGCDPALIRLTVGDTALPADADKIGDRLQRLHVTTDAGGRLVAAVGIATHWKMLWSHDLVFCTAPSGLIFLQSFHTPPVYAWVEDDRFLLDRGSPLPTVAQQRQAMAAFDADFEALKGGTL